MFHFLFVFLDQLVILVHINIRELAHCLPLLLAPAGLIAQVFVLLGLEDAELVHLSLGNHAQATIAGGAIAETGPEIGESVDDRGIVADSSAEVARTVEQQGAVEDGHDIGRLILDDEVEIIDGAVIVANLYAQLSAVVVCQEVVGFQFDGLVIVGHGSAKVIDIVARKGAVDVIACHGGFEVDGFGELCVGILPLLPAHGNHAAHHPCLTVVLVQFEGFIQMTCRPDGIFLTESHFSLQLPCLGVVFPAVGHRVEVGIGLIVILVLNATEHTVVPKTLTGGIILDAAIVVGNSFLVLLLADTAKTAQLVLTGNVRIETDGLGTVVLGSHPVVEIELGHSPEEPGLVEIGLSGNDLIEILYGQHVILIIEGCTPGCQYAVDVVLGECEKGTEEKEKEKTHPPTPPYMEGSNQS